MKTNYLDWDFEKKEREKFRNKHKCLNCDTAIYIDTLFCKKCLKLGIMNRLKIFVEKNVKNKKK